MTPEVERPHVVVVDEEPLMRWFLSELAAIDVNLTRDQVTHSPSVDTADIESIETLPSLMMM